MGRDTSTDSERNTRGFRQAGALLARSLREVGESRGFAVSRVLTHWDEIAGPDLARCTRPVEVSYARHGFGATLTILTTGAFAPLVEMQKERLRERVNACYGYAAVSAIRLTQTAATGFAEDRTPFSVVSDSTADHPPEQVRANARALAAEIEDAELRVALAELGANILSRTNKSKGRL